MTDFQDLKELPSELEYDKEYTDFKNSIKSFSPTDEQPNMDFGSNDESDIEQIE